MQKMGRKVWCKFQVQDASRSCLLRGQGRRCSGVTALGLRGPGGQASRWPLVRRRQATAPSRIYPLTLPRAPLAVGPFSAWLRAWLVGRRLDGPGAPATTGHLASFITYISRAPLGEPVPFSGDMRQHGLRLVLSSILQLALSSLVPALTCLPASGLHAPYLL